MKIGSNTYQLEEGYWVEQDISPDRKWDVIKLLAKEQGFGIKLEYNENTGFTVFLSKGKTTFKIGDGRDTVKFLKEYRHGKI